MENGTETRAAREAGQEAAAQEVKHAVALAITDPRAPGLILAVRRPPDDADLPDIWGLPAASLRPGETWHAAAARAAREKLGVEITLEREVTRGHAARGTTRLEMRLYRARIASGLPRVPQSVPGVTQYRALRWALPDILEAGAARGSLCCQLQLGRVAPSPP